VSGHLGDIKLLGFLDKVLGTYLSSSTHKLFGQRESFTYSINCFNESDPADL
jgi:hypothetical protein